MMTMLFIAMALSVLAIVGVGIGVFVRVRRKNAAQANPQSDEEEAPRFPARRAPVSERSGIARVNESDISA